MIFLQLIALLLIFDHQSAGQVCPAGRTASNRQFGFARSAGQGVNESYFYLTFLQDISPGSTPMECSGVANLLSMQKVEAALWATATFRSRYPSLLPGVTVGALILDACQSSLVPVQLLGNLQTCETAFSDSIGGSVEPRNMAAFIGVDSMSQASDTFSLTNWTGKATITTELASGTLNRPFYPLLGRLVPSELAELDAIGQVLASLGVRHVQVVHSAASVQDGRYAVLADEAQTRLSRVGICVVNRVAFEGTAGAAASVAAWPRIRPVLLLMPIKELLAFSDQMLSLMPNSGMFTWLLTSEHWSSINQLVLGRENFYAGALVLSSAATASYSDYLNYFRSVRPDTAGHQVKNPWLSTFWMNTFRCNVPGIPGNADFATCNYVTQNLQSTASVDPSVVRVIQSADLILHSLEVTRRTICGGESVGLCDAFRSDPNRYRIAYSNLYSVKSLGYTDSELDPVTGAAAKYILQVQNYQKRYPGYAWSQIAQSQSGSLSVISQAQAYGVDERFTTWAPSGVCDLACLTKCPSNDTTTPTTIRVALTTSAPVTASTTGPDQSQMRYRKQNWVYALIVCASVGILVTLLFMIYILFKVLGLPSELKSFNTLWSGQFLLFIILIGYVFLFAWVPWPCIESCGTIRFMLGFEYAAIFSILMVKLLNLMNDQLKPVFQVLMFVLGLGVQIAINAEWLILVPISITTTDGTQRCAHSLDQHLQSLVYCMALILLCTCLAVRAHSIGRNNRESIFVGCTAGISIPIWIAWGLVGSLNQDPEVKDASVAFGLFVNLTLVLLVIFLPKIHQLRLLESSDGSKNVVVEEDAYDIDDAYGKDPIYMLTQGAPSVISQEAAIAGGGQILLTSATDVFALPSPAPAYYATRSLQGEPSIMPVFFNEHASSGFSPHSVIPGRTAARKAFSDYNPAHQRHGSAPGSDRGHPAVLEASVDVKETKAQRLAKLGFL